MVAFPFGGMPEWLKGTGCKPVGVSLRWFESSSLHQKTITPLARYADGVFFLQKAWRESQSFGQILKKRICLRIVIPIRPQPRKGGSCQIGAERSTAPGHTALCFFKD